MKRVAGQLIVLLVVLGLFPGVFEAIENTSHLIREGHLAHGEADGDRHDPAGSEHNCNTTLHLCSCCISLPLMIRKDFSEISFQPAQSFLLQHASIFLAVSESGIYHPPKV